MFAVPDDTLSSLGDNTRYDDEPSTTPAGSPPESSNVDDRDHDQYDDYGLHDDEDGESENGDGDIWMNMSHNTAPRRLASAFEVSSASNQEGNEDDDGDGYRTDPDKHGGSASDLMDFTTPAATARVRKEAESLYRASRLRSYHQRREYRCADFAKDLYHRMGPTELTEPAALLIHTEELVSRLYDDGIGIDDDAEQMDRVLADVAGSLVLTWHRHAATLPLPVDEHAAGIGPSPHAPPFEVAHYLASLALQIHHTRSDEGSCTEPLPLTMIRWMSHGHNLYPSQTNAVLNYRPSPACHALFWQTVFVTLVKGDVATAERLLRQAGWEHVKKGPDGRFAYASTELASLERAVAETCDVLHSCPAAKGNWEVLSSDWTLFRIQAKGALDQLRRFVEGREPGPRDDNIFAPGVSFARHGSVADLARRAESRVPWEVYENLNIIFQVVLGSAQAIFGIAQDWCEAAVGLFAWWDETRPMEPSPPLARSQRLTLASHQHHHAFNPDHYINRLARAFHLALDHGFHFEPRNPVEVGLACIFEQDISAVIGILRAFSLPVAAAVAQTASIAGWLPPCQQVGPTGLENLDDADLDLLNIHPPNPDDTDGIKDNTLITYAQRLANYRELSGFSDNLGRTHDGWELALRVLGRLDSSERSEALIGNLVRDLLARIDADSTGTVELVWALLNELGLLTYAEEVAETYGDILARESHRYGEAMWFFAVAHRPNKVREVMNLLIAYSLLHSTVFPPTDDLDPHLARLLSDRTATLSHLAQQDHAAAELLGKLLSGYASLRHFYNLRDGTATTTFSSASSSSSLPTTLTPHHRRQLAAATLTSVIASADDNIRGGLFDASRDAIVSEDFLLALLAEATVFVSDPYAAFDPMTPPTPAPSSPRPCLTLDQIQILLKAIEDLETVGPRVFATCHHFFSLALASRPGMPSSTPKDLLRQSADAPGTLVLGGAPLVVEKLRRSLGGLERVGTRAGEKQARLGWDWRAGVRASTTGAEVLRRLRMGLAQDLAAIWVEEADRAACARS